MRSTMPTGSGVRVPDAAPSRITVPPILYTGLVPGMDGALAAVMGNAGGLISVLTLTEEVFVKARDSVRGRKNPTLPSGMLRPWTT